MIFSLQANFEREILAQIEKQTKQVVEQNNLNHKRKRVSNQNTSRKRVIEDDCLSKNWKKRIQSQQEVNQLFDNRALYIVNPDDEDDSEESDTEDSELCS